MDTQKGNADLEPVQAILENVLSAGIEWLLRNDQKEGDNLYLENSEAECVKSFQWTTCENFTVERGQQEIEDYISTWELHESWKHWLEFLQEEDLEYIWRYQYRVIWSIPTRRRPIPYATASVYFAIDVSKIKPATLPVEVFFTLEGNRLKHRPEYCRFREKWLKDIIENKRMLMANRALQ